jgi:DNA-binding NarL/FixJ family response regulator
MNLLIIDKSKLITDRLLTWLKEAEGIKTINAAATFAEAIIIAEHVRPDIVLLDMNLPSLKSVDIIKNIKKQITKHHLL